MNSLIEADTWDWWTFQKIGKLLRIARYTKLKKKSEGKTGRFKARLVAKGFLQKPGTEFHDTFSPVVSWKTIGAVISLAASECLKFAQFVLPQFVLFVLPQLHKCLSIS